MIICLNKSVLDFMESKINKDSFVFEFGSGGSTRWFADRCRSLLSVETSEEWADKAAASMVGASCDWGILLNPTNIDFETRNFDLALIDGHASSRFNWTITAWKRVKAGGWLLFDDAQRPRHKDAVNWMNKFCEPVELRWAAGDIKSAKERLTLAWQKS